jgi:hypothetical protein
MISGNLKEIIFRVLDYCRVPRNENQIVRKMGFFDLEADSYLLALKKKNLLNEDYGDYLITTTGLSYLKSRKRIAVALQK